MCSHVSRCRQWDARPNQSNSVIVFDWLKIFHPALVLELAQRTVFSMDTTRPLTPCPLTAVQAGTEVTSHLIL